MREDELATRVVDHYDVVHDDAEIRLEEPYEAGSSRGVADVYVRTKTPERVDRVVELKGDAAVRRATGANAVLRQFRRMERYFYDDNAHAIRRKLGRTEPGVHFLLLFAPTPTCVHHVATHASLYGSVDVAASVDDVPAVRKVAFLIGLDGGPSDLSFLSVNADAPFGSPAFLDAVPPNSRLAESLRKVDDELVSYD
ncbi:hypothetical protein JCM17823_01610 [Halorubrum gandharaense]